MPKSSEEVRGDWRKLHNEELHYDLYSLPNVDVKVRKADCCGPVGGPVVQHGA